ncbi:hypothetical protein F5B22DRAFT_654586 [Xylaria bambusicola]|uniref:uncharacterized protein n=1 Tax=Xylaria bambusicola TaxID=326684 RepID=UPI0020073F07|nr:uncharacterized protein F5B22DRAFT_654586 [Xylaria bambusicola]KAI0517826.1 hypothetical protein F5B22DRAFT_654586 [Xylaria bambusicola]
MVLSRVRAPHPDSLEVAKLAAQKRLRQLFRICLRSRNFYFATRGRDVFWQFVSEHWDVFEYLAPANVTALVRANEEIRDDGLEGVLKGRLKKLVDRFTMMHKEMLSRDRKRLYRITLRPSTILSTARRNSRQVSSYLLSAASIPWPPTHFTKQEIVWFCHDHVLSQVYGLTSDTKLTKAAQFPQIPDAYTHPLDVRLFLAFTALINISSNRNISICMTPITFWDDDERSDWFHATAGASKFCWTTWDFCQWAKKEFERGRETVIGLCHFSKTAPRYSVGVLIRKLEKDSYEFIMEDAHHHRVSANPGYYRDKYGVYPDTGMDFKAALLEDVAAHFNITSFWRGGDVPNAFADFGIGLRDTVSTSCSFVFLAAQGKVPTQNLYQDGWNFSRGIPKKMQYWEEQDEELTEEELTDWDDDDSDYRDD